MFGWRILNEYATRNTKA